MPKRAYINPPPGDIPEDAPKDAVKIEFAKRLQSLMVAKGWNQSELARRAEDYIPKVDGKKGRFGRDNISTYMRGKAIPGPKHLTALSKALGCKPEDLLPTRGIPSAETTSPPMEIRKLADGNAWLRINQAVEMSVALKILNILEAADANNAS